MSPVALSEEENNAGLMAERPKLYHRVTFPHGYVVVVPPDALADCLNDADDAPACVEKVYLTDAEYEALPEFES